MQNKKAEVKIAGRMYNLVSGEDPEYLKELAVYVSGKISEIMHTTHATPYSAAVLAALNIADEYHKSMESIELLREQLSKQNENKE